MAAETQPYVIVVLQPDGVVAVTGNGGQNHRRAEFLKSKRLIQFLYRNRLPGRPLLDVHHEA